MALINVNYPERTVYRDIHTETTKKVHVHRAPTDESVALLKEMEQAAMDKLVQSFRLDDCPIDCKVAAFEDIMNDSREYHLYFKINGKEHGALYVYRHYKQFPHEEAIEVARGCAQVMSDKISEVLLKDAFTKAFWRYYK